MLVVLVLMLENELVLNLLFNAANVDSVAAPVGNGKLTALTGWVACQKVPLTGCVDCQKVPLTGTALALNCVSVRPCTKLLSTGTYRYSEMAF